jgi:hypothetical protein
MEKIMKNIKTIIVSFVVFFATISLQAKLYVSQSDEQFYREVARHNLAVVHFNPYPVDSREFKLGRMKDAYVTLASSDRFKDADVAFIGVNLHVVPELVYDFDLELAPIVNGEQDMAHAPRYTDAEASALGMSADEEKGVVENGSVRGEERSVSNHRKETEKKTDVAMKHISEMKPEEQAVVMLFKDGKPLIEDGKKVMRTGFMTKIELQDFINKYFGSAIDQRLAQKKEEERERLQVRYVQKPKRQLVERVYYTDSYDRDYYYEPDYYYYPTYRRTGYYGYPYGYWPAFGMGFGFGGRRGGFSFGFGW